MLDEEVVEKLRLRYPQVHPLMFQRSVERARTVGDLFDILETVPKEYPIVWSDEDHCWITTKDIYQSQGFIR